ncbi:phage tail assembly protein [Roseospira marina]|uniref:Phage tail assembly protein n=1 Tax=Roseospira marina TaxID=140057 RepID=A0A5M6I5Y2_9PROT|nr:phage tail assembly protein [Roseospira marina]KAA5603245.1 phage tail assembly protein [Roseospira marina]MBB4316181.1 hypothetical protein [Roseospira marina]MBB5089380.1 hypothetical protein [Roseospira marina]
MSEPTTEPTTLALTVPITVDGRTLSTVTLRRPKVGDLRRMDRAGSGDLDKTLWLIGSLADLTPAEVDELDARDLATIGEVVAGFTGTAV